MSLRTDQLAYLWYPLVLMTAIIFHVVLLQTGLSLLFCAYLPLMFSAIAITVLEIYYPYREEWKPNRHDLMNDGVFMVVVQMILPQLLSFLIAIVLIRETEFSYWPSDLPIVVQLGIMILAADFLRYWLHVASHNLLPLWQLHAVHHSPKILYWFNVGRFHPLEKAVQFLFDALPFILLGIDERVLALYFVCYATNGFFQHSNVHVKLGWLNYVISGPELHRWHHSIHIHESNRNYGNNIILWDLLFGTFYLPKNRSVSDLGLRNRSYPTSFLQQMKTPFIIRLESANLPIVSYKDIVINSLLRLRFEYQYLTMRMRMLAATRSPRKHQLILLNSLIRRNQASKFGQDFQFPKIVSYSDYQMHCPISTYESLSSYIDLAVLANNGLTIEPPVFYQVTSGTLGHPKYLPVTAAGLNNISSEQSLVALTRYLNNPGTFSGKIFAVVSPAIEGYTASGLPYGSASGLLYQNMPAMARSKYVVPSDVFNIRQYDAKYLLLALFALAESRVTIIATANPSTLVRLLEVINTHALALIEMLESGSIVLPQYQESLPSSITACFSAQPERAKVFKEIVLRNKHLSYADLWPNLQTLATWTGGSCGIPLTALKKDLPPDIKISEMGYLASEMRGTITIDDEHGVPTFLNHFFEFISVDDWESDRKNSKLLDELIVGEKYYIIVTTVNGLYRYFMNDIVEVTDFINKTPTLKFIQKGRGVTNITGEKLYEGQILAAIRAVQTKHHVSVIFHQWLANESESYYQVFIERSDNTVLNQETCELALEQALGELNVEYQQKRESGRLKPLRVCFLKPGTGEIFRQKLIADGQREGQLKSLTLLYLKDSHFPFLSHVLLK